MKHSNKLIAALCAGLLVSGFAAAALKDANTTDFAIKTANNLTLSNFNFDGLAAQQKNCGANCYEYGLQAIQNPEGMTMQFQIQAITEKGAICSNVETVNFDDLGAVIYDGPNVFKYSLSAASGCSPDPYFVYASVVGDSQNGYTLMLMDDGISK